jgi:hypothetical protein
MKSKKYTLYLTHNQPNKDQNHEYRSRRGKY